MTRSGVRAGMLSGVGVDPVAFAELIVRVGTAMVAAGDSVDSVETSLRRIIDAYDVPDVQIAVLPTSLFYGTGRGVAAEVRFSTHVGPALRFDQIDALYGVVRRLQHGEPSPEEALGELDEIEESSPRLGAPVRVGGHAVLCTGAALLLHTTPWGIAAVVVLGLVVGLMKLPHLPTLRVIFPLIAAFTVAMIVFAASRHVAADNPIRLLVPPLVTLIPGGMLAIGTMELVAGEAVSGSSRLVNGLVQLALLSFGIVAAAALLRVPASELLDRPGVEIGSWATPVGVLLFGLGVCLHFSAPARSVPWIILVLAVASAGQTFADVLFGARLSAFFGALAMTPVVLWIDERRSGPPKLVTFLPGFWLLVPGAAGLIGLTSIVGAGADAGARAFTDVLSTIMAVALGVLTGAAAYRSADAGARLLVRGGTTRNG